MKKAGLLVASMLLLACTSNPYVTHTTVNETMNQRVESVCTHKTAFIPWYAVVAFGLFTFRYGHECHDEVSTLSEPSKYVEGTPSQDDPTKSAEKGTENKPCPSGQVMTNSLCESPATVEQKVPIPEPSSNENRVVP